MKNIDIVTSQNVLIEYQLASVGERILAFFIDAAVLFFIILCWFQIGGLTAIFFSDDQFMTIFLFRFFPLLLVFAYFLLMEGFTGQTIGKKALGIKVVRLDGQEPAIGDYALRTLFHLVDVLLTSGLLAIILVAMSAKRQRVGDMAANTSVVKLNPSSVFTLSDILKIDSLESYEPIFPQVLLLKEDDMLIVKSVLARYRMYQNEAHANIAIETVRHLVTILDIKEYPRDNLSFLNTILKDYIVLTR
jgi:uncharacterized RDD family membrane protein YckC